MSLKGYRVALVVLGDVGRSPRMQYHALSLLSEGAEVSIVGYEGEALVPPLQKQISKLDQRLFAPLEGTWLKNKCWPLFAVVKAAALVFQLALALLRIKRPDLILVQNPPAIPALPVACLVGFLRGAAVVIDWHNLGFTVTFLSCKPFV